MIRTVERIHFHDLVIPIISALDSEMYNDAAPPPPDSVPSEFIIDQASVEIKLSRINIHKAQGPDDLPNCTAWVLRDFCANLAGPVCSIFNASVREGFVPGRWKEVSK